MDPLAFDDEPPPEPREGWLLVRIYVPELNIHKCLQFPSEKLVWDVKQQVLASLPKELKESFNYGLFCPPLNGRAGKFLDEERRLGDYPFNGPIGYFELKYKRRVYKMLNLDEKQLKALHTRANLRRFLECINGGHVEKVSKMCTKGLDPNFHCQETGETPLSVATKAKKPNKLLIALVNGGALLDYRTKDGVTALHRAVEYDSLEAVSTLLELGASPNYRDTKNITPIYLCVTKKSDPRICETLLHDHATLGITDSQGWQEVHQACRYGLAHHLEHLLFYGADMDGQNASGNTPLHVCAVNNQEACARMLLFRGAQRDALNYANQTPYQVAVIAGNLELAEMIQSYKSEDIVPFRGPPRYNPRRRSGLGWGNILSRIGGPPSPCPSDHPYSSASSEGSSSHRSHEDDVSIVTDKSIGDTSDIISDSSGVGTNSDSAACSIGHPSTTVVCFEAYTPTAQNANSGGHLTVNPGDVIEVVGSTDCGLLEGFVRGTSRTGFFPATCVQEVQFRQNKGAMSVAPTQYSSTSTLIVQSDDQHQQQQQQKHFDVVTNGVTNEIITASHKVLTLTPTDRKRFFNESTRTVVLHRAKRGFGFVLRGAKQSSPLMQSSKYPALQYLDDVDPGGVADLAGLKVGDFLVEINGEDVTSASHERVVDLIRKSGSLVQMTVLSMSVLEANDHFNNGHQQQQLLEHVPKKMSSSYHAATSNMRQCSTLPRRLSQPGKLQAPAPPRRDPRTTLSVGRARAKSLVAGLDADDPDKKVAEDTNGGSIEHHDKITSSTSVEAMNHYQQQHYQGLSGWSTPLATGPGTPTQFRTASIKSRPTSSRITAAEIKELFSRQHSVDDRRLSGIATSRFHEDIYSPPQQRGSPGSAKGALVYASVADMKRKAKSKMSGTLRGRPVPIPTVQGELKRSFHSTPDLANVPLGSVNSVADWTAATFKSHHSQDDVHRLQSTRSLTRLNLPPPDHPPPPAPTVGQVVKVDISRSEYECPANLKKPTRKEEDGEVMSSFKPDANAKLYASPQELKIMAIRREEVAKLQPPKEVSPYETTTASTGNSISPAPPIPEPDYSLSESEEEHDTVRNVQIIPIKANVEYQEAGIYIGNSSSNNENSNTILNGSGSSSGNGSSISSGSQAGSINKNSSNSGSIKGFCAEELSRIRLNLKSSKSFPNDLVQPCETSNKNVGEHDRDGGDNSSSGVSSDQETDRKKAQQHEFPVTIVKGSHQQFEQKNFMQELSATTDKIMNGGGLKKSTMPTPVTTKVTSSIVTRMISESEKKKPVVVTTTPNPTPKPTIQNASSVEERSEDDDDDDADSPSPPSFQFQRHNSLTRKQAAIAAQRAKAMQHSMRAVSLAKLPPPIEHDDAHEKPDDVVMVLAPPPEFSDFTAAAAANTYNNNNKPSSIIQQKPKTKFKTSRLHSQ